MKVDMDLVNEQTSFEELLMMNPNNKKSLEDCEKVASSIDFYTNVYPDHVIDPLIHATRVKRAIIPPKCIFLPCKELIRTVVKANLKHAKKDTLQEFLLRFGLMENPNWYLNLIH